MVSKYTGRPEINISKIAYGAEAAYCTSLVCSQTLVANVSIPVGRRISVAVSSVMIFMDTKANPAPTPDHTSGRTTFIKMAMGVFRSEERRVGKESGMGGEM